MKVTFGAYPDNRGHTSSDGCFRCHDDTKAAKDGTKISGDSDTATRKSGTLRAESAGSNQGSG